MSNKPLRLSANIGFLWTDRPHADRIRAACAAGFDAVECHFPYDDPIADIKAALDETGLPMIGLNTPPGDLSAGEFGLAALPGRKADARDAIDEAARFGAAIGAKNIHVMAGVPKQGQERVAHKTFIDNLKYATGVCGRNNQTVLIEPINAYDASGYLVQYVEYAQMIIAEVGAPNVKIMFDCYHVQLMQGSLIRRLEYLLPRGLIGHIQFAAVPDRGEPDAGEIAFDRLLPAIAAMGYNGYFGAEYKPRAEIEEGLSWMAPFR